MKKLTENEWINFEKDIFEEVKLSEIITESIHKVINEKIQNNFEKEIDEGLWGYVEMKSDKINLPVTLFLDVNSSYKHYNHPPCLYVANSYMSYDSLIPIGLSYNPDIYMMPNELGIHRGDLFKIIKFISRHHKELLELANEIIDYRIFHQRLRGIFESMELLIEMPIINKSITGLPLDIWIDKGNHQNKCEHGARIKFKSSSEPNPNNWASITLPDMIIPQYHQVDVRQKDVNKIMEFVQLNYDNLMRLVNQEIDYEEFIVRMITFDRNGDIIYPNVGNTYISYKDGNFGFTIIKNDLNKYNYINNNTSKILLVDENEKPVWLDTANIFKKYNNGTICAYVELNNQGYYLTTTGQLNKIN